MTFEELVDKERTYQDKLWGEQNHPPFTWFAILAEEIGELNSAWLHEEFNIFPNTSASEHGEDIEKELIHCAAILKAMYESGKRNNWL